MFVFVFCSAQPFSPILSIFAMAAVLTLFVQCRGCFLFMLALFCFQIKGLRPTSGLRDRHWEGERRQNNSLGMVETGPGRHRERKTVAQIRDPTTPWLWELTSPLSPWDIQGGTQTSKGRLPQLCTSPNQWKGSSKSKQQELQHHKRGPRQHES